MASLTLNSKNCAYGSYDGRYMEFTVTQTDATTLSWTLTVKGGSATYYKTGPTIAKIGSTEVYNKARVTKKESAEFPNCKGSTSGTYTLSGTETSVSCSLSTFVWYGTGDGRTSSTSGTLSIPYITIDYKPNGGTHSATTSVVSGKTYYVGTNSNGYLYMNTSSSSKTKKTQKYYYNGSSWNPVNDTSFALVRSGYRFKGWLNSATSKILDQNTNYAASTVHSSIASGNQTITLTAQWEAVPAASEVKVQYDFYGSPSGITIDTSTGYRWDPQYETSGTYYHRVQEGSQTVSYILNLKNSSVTHTAIHPSVFGISIPGYTFNSYKTSKKSDVKAGTSYYASQLTDSAGTCWLNGSNWDSAYSITLNPNGGRFVYNKNGSTTTSQQTYYFSKSKSYVAISTLKDYSLDDGVTVEFGSNAAKYLEPGFFIPGPPTRSGYTFSGWSLSSGESISHINFDACNNSGKKLVAYALSNPKKNLTATANWSPNTYTISYDIGEDATGGPSAGTKTHGSSYTISSTIPTRTGYRFVGWGDDDTSTTNLKHGGDTYTRNADKTFHAVWSLITNVQYKAVVLGSKESFIFSPSSTGTYSIESFYGSSTLQNLEIEVYNASGTLITSKTGGGASYKNFKLTTSFTKDTVYTLKIGLTSILAALSIPFKITGGYTLSYDLKGGTNAASFSKQEGATSYTIHSTLPVRFGYTFTGWKKSGSTTIYLPGGSSGTLSGNTVLEAQWEKAPQIYTGLNVCDSVCVNNVMRYYTFTPANTGLYHIESHSSGTDPDIRIFNAAESTTNTITGGSQASNGNFNFNIQLTKGTKYTLQMQHYDTKNSFPFSITLVIEQEPFEINYLDNTQNWFEFTPSITGYYRLYPNNKNIAWNSGKLYSSIQNQTLIKDFLTKPIEYKLEKDTTYYFYVNNSTGAPLDFKLVGVQQIFVDGTWQRAIPYIYDGTSWRQAISKVYDDVDKEWKFTI